MLGIDWRSETEDYRAKVRPYREMTVEQRIHALSQLLAFQRRLLQDPERRRRWTIAREQRVAEGRAAIARTLSRSIGDG